MAAETVDGLQGLREVVVFGQGDRQLGRLRRVTQALHRARTWKAVLRQLVAALLTVLAVSAVTFLATNIKSPEDVARSALGRNATSEQITAFVAARDLDAPLPARYAKWLGDLVQGDWGTSVVTDRPIQPELMPRLGRTLLLAGLSFLVVVPLSIALGGYLAARWGTRLDVAATSGLTILSAFPEFVVGVGAILFFSVLLGILPPESATAIAFGTPGAKAAAYILPALTLVLVAAPFLVRLTRASAREGLAAAHTRAATLRGLARRTVIWDYGLRAAAVPVVSATGLTLVHLLGGTIVVENLFGFPGFGQALVIAVGTGDTVAVQAIAVVTAALFIALLTIPPLLTVLVLLASLGRSPLVIILVVGLVFIPWVGRVARGAAQAVVTNDYVHAAMARGEGTGWILRREVLPNIAAPLIGAFSLYLTSGIVFVSTLSFLGLGDQPPSSSWGLMVAESRGFITTNPVATLAPAAGIAAVSVSFMLIADAITRHVVRDTGYSQLVP